MTSTRCVDCGKALPRARRGRPRERCDRCQTEHRRAYWRDRKRAERGTRTHRER